MIAVAVGLLIAIASWVPLWIVEARDPYSIPIVLGLFAVAGSIVGGVIALIGLVRLVRRAYRRA
ncbi:MAG: hypothetical protein E6G73_11315 [Alphaproteobacteria bacterium]|jgi:hypothetical protein|nr:MAG: hypothetical protein E6G73_11315 [Alphaproteobacteria bacterium]